MRIHLYPQFGIPQCIKQLFMHSGHSFSKWKLALTSRNALPQTYLRPFQDHPRPFYDHTRIFLLFFIFISGDLGMVSDPIVNIENLVQKLNKNVLKVCVLLCWGHINHFFFKSSLILFGVATRYFIYQLLSPYVALKIY